MADTIEERRRASAGLPAPVFGHWVHSREEDAEGLEVFRPAGFAFPPSFGRDGFEMHEDGLFVQEDIGPADGVVRVSGRWTLLGSRLVAVSFPLTATREGFTFEVVQVDQSTLRIRRGAAHSSPGYASCPAMDEASLQAYQALPPATSLRRLDFDEAQVITLESFPPQFVLQVSGTKPYANLHVDLVPMVYVQQPEYWQIEVVGSLPGLGLPALAPYVVHLRLAGTVGTRGIEVVGATRSERFNVPPQDPAQAECGEWAAWIDRQPPGPATLHVTGRCEFPSGGFTVELRRHEPQGFNPRDLLLDKIVTPPSGPASTAITTVDVRYREDNPPDFDTVTILPDITQIRVQEAR